MASSDKPTSTSESSSSGGDRNQPETTAGEDVGKDEVDFVIKVPTSVDSDACLTCNKNPKTSGALNNNCTHGKTLDKFNIFHLKRRPKSDPGTGTIAKHAQQNRSEEPTDPNAKKKKSRFVKSASIARIFGNNYNTKKYEQDSGALLKLQQLKRSFLNSERFHRKDPATANSDSNQPVKQESQQDPGPHIGDGCYVNDSEIKAKAIRSITRGLGRLWRRNSHSIEISRPDPEYKVSYLGNVLTGWAKGKCRQSFSKGFVRFISDSFTMGE
ncbi:uncharacterized protein LOC134284479 [Aedes albopictus]|uniref:Uncharacterized protein n=1 Tax=Aedes albopictus TaxID=7160 RepID=A0ABM1ZN84_AEDAL